MISQSRSASLFERGRRVVPDGVSSPMRTFSLVGGQPICAASAEGSRVTDVDGNVYVDFLNAFGALILGHAHRDVVAAIATQAARGTVLGLSTELEYDLAEIIVASTPAIEAIRFVCSGTEAVMTAVRIARAHTERNLIVKFRGSYHGHADALLASPQSSDIAVKSKGNSKGIPEQLHRDVLLCDYNDGDGLEQLFVTHGDQIAAVLVEPFATNMGFVKPVAGFLRTIQERCRRHGALFIFDEVVTGFRFRFGGVSASLNIDPDLVTFGKIIGGGTPIGAFAGKARYLQHVITGGAVFQSGTFAANPLTMAAGNAALGVLAGSGFYAAMERRGAVLEAAVLAQFASRNLPFYFSRHGALAGVAFRDDGEPMKSYRDVKGQRYDVHKRAHRLMLERGYLLAPSLEEPIFLSAAHSDDDIVGFADALADAIEQAIGDSRAPARTRSAALSA